MSHVSVSGHFIQFVWSTVRSTAFWLLVLLGIPWVPPANSGASAADRSTLAVFGKASPADSEGAAGLAKSSSGSDGDSGNSGSGGGGNSGSGSGGSGKGEDDDDDDNSGSGNGDDDDDDDERGDDNSGPGSGDDDDEGEDDNRGPGSGGDDRDDRIRREGRDREIIGGVEAELNARWEQRDDRTIFRVQVRNLLLDPPQTLTVCAISTAGEVLVEGSLSLNAFGAGEFKIDSRNGTVVPAIAPGDRADVRFGSCTSGETPILSATIGGAFPGDTPGDEPGDPLPHGGRIRREGRDREIISGVQAELNARWEQRDDRTIFRAEVRNLLIDAAGPLNVCVFDGTDGSLILSGQLALNDFGSGEFKLDSRKGDDVPAVQPGDVVHVQREGCSSGDAPILSATIGGGVSMIPREGDRIRREGRDHEIIDGAEVELNARWEQRDDRTTLQVEVERFLARQGTTLNVCFISGGSGDVFLEGQVALNSLGTGELKLDSRNGDTVPVVEPGDIVNIQDETCSADASPLLSATIGSGGISDSSPAASCGLEVADTHGSDDSEFFVTAAGVDGEDGSLEPIIELFAIDLENNDQFIALLEVGDKLRLRSGRDRIRVKLAEGSDLVDHEFEVRAEAPSFRLSCTVSDSEGMAGVDDVWVAPGVSTAVKLTRNGIVNAATFGPSGTLSEAVAPGSIVSLFGEFGVDTTQAQRIPLPAELNGISVTVNGVPAPLFFVSAGQINAQLPWSALKAGQSAGLASVQVASHGIVSPARTVRIRDFAPGIFTLQAGTGQAVAMNHDGTLAQPLDSVPGVASRPARPGEALVILATGLGSATVFIAEGQAAGDDIVPTELTPDVLIGGRPAQVTFSGLSPEFVGVNQLNVLTPDVTAGDQIPLQLRLGPAITSDEVTIAVE